MHFASGDCNSFFTMPCISELARYIRTCVFGYITDDLIDHQPLFSFYYTSFPCQNDYIWCLFFSTFLLIAGHIFCDICFSRPEMTHCPECRIKLGKNKIMVTKFVYTVTVYVVLSLTKINKINK
jgi:hypothetical protein